VPKQTIADLANTVPQLRKHIVLPGCGHWTQQERANEVQCRDDRVPQVALEPA